jgi:hypothetical protein
MIIEPKKATFKCLATLGEYVVIYNDMYHKPLTRTD